MNATTLAIEKGYPERQQLPDELVSWETSIPDDVPYGDTIVNVSEKHGTIIEKLARKGFDVPSINTVRDLARMSTSDVVAHHGRELADSLSKLRYPLGRTGLNGVGIFYEAGASQTADMISIFDDGEERWLPLVYNRGKWNTPGGFREDYDLDGRATAIRETAEEIGHDLSEANIIQIVSNINQTSPRLTDHAWMESEVYATQVDRPFMLTAGDDAEAAKWVRVSQLQGMVATRQLSSSKLNHILNAVQKLGL